MDSHVLGRLERAFEGVVERTMSGVFRLRVQPAEIGRRLERAMLDGRVTSVGAPLAPNRYEIHLHPDDAAEFADWQDALCREMESWLAELAFARGLSTIGPIRVGIREDAAVRRRGVGATARFDAGAEKADFPRFRDTVRGPLLRLLPELAGFPAAALSTGGLTIGRAPENDLVIADPEVSRHHARLDVAEQVWHVVDLSSTNGTWINDDRVSRGEIKAGDVLAFGSVRFRIMTG